MGNKLFFSKKSQPPLNIKCSVPNSVLLMRPRMILYIDYSMNTVVVCFGFTELCTRQQLGVIYHLFLNMKYERDSI